VSISSEAKGDIKAAQKVRLPWWALVLIGALSLPIFWLFDNFRSLGMSLPVLESIIALGFVLYVKGNETRVSRASGASSVCQGVTRGGLLGSAMGGEWTLASRSISDCSASENTLDRCNNP
jgi:hypothetical protein